MNWIFEVETRLVGHKCSVRAAHGEAFVAFKRLVRWLANSASVPRRLDPKAAYEVDTEIYFKGRAHTDPENVRKAIIDALWKNDRRVLGGSYRTFEGFPKERVTIRVRKVV